MQELSQQASDVFNIMEGEDLKEKCNCKIWKDGPYRHYRVCSIHVKQQDKEECKCLCHYLNSKGEDKFHKLCIGKQQNKQESWEDRLIGLSGNYKSSLEEKEV